MVAQNIFARDAFPLPKRMCRRVHRTMSLERDSIEKQPENGTPRSDVVDSLKCAAHPDVDSQPTGPMAQFVGMLVALELVMLGMFRGPALGMFY